MAHNVPEELKYTKEHEWTKIEGDVATIGITDFAQSSLGDIVFVELPEVGTQLNKDDAFGVVESIKSVSDLYSPLTGEVLERNEELESQPEQCNESPYGSWMIKLKIADDSQVAELLSSSDYGSFCEDN